MNTRRPGQFGGSDMNGLEDFFNSLGQSRKSISTIILIVVGILVLAGSSFIVEPGHRGVLVTMGKVSPTFAPEGLGLKAPFITTVLPVSVRQQSKSAVAECYSSDLQQVAIDIRILYRIPEASVVKIFQEFAGDPFDSLVAPRVSEALKEVTALQSAEQIVKKREEIKTRSLESARKKIGDLIVIEDIVISNVSLSKELEAAIESKMVQEQEAAKARFTQQKAEIESNTAIIKARGEAEAIRIRGRALQDSPGLVQLQIVEKWNGITPQVVGVGAGGSGANILLPIGGGTR